MCKNVRRAYQPDRLDVEIDHRVAVLLFQDGHDNEPGRIAVLDVGGAMLDDVEAWSVWHDPSASHRSSRLDEEQTQGQGGKAYLFAMFEGQCRFLGINDRKRNSKGFDGPPESEDRGTPGWIPSEAEGREVPIASIGAELSTALEPYGIAPDDLPTSVREAIFGRQAFTLVEGVAPADMYKQRVPAEDLVWKLLRHDQTALVIEQVEMYAFHNGKMMNAEKHLQLPEIPPYPTLEKPEVYVIPDELPLPNGQLISTTEGGKRAAGRLTLFTSKDNMHWAYKLLRPRWRMNYRAGKQMIGSKSIAELSPGSSGAQYVYGVIELPALDPGYVETGRKRPKEGPLLEAVDAFITDKIAEVAKRINDLRRQELDERSLDRVHEENRRLDTFKNNFLPSGQGGSGSGEGGDDPSKKRRRRTEKPKPGLPSELEYALPEGGLHVGRDVDVSLSYQLGVRVLDGDGIRIATPRLEWFSSDPKVARVEGDWLKPVAKGKCDVWVRVKGTALESEHVSVRVWSVEHIFLAPRELSVEVGKKSLITAEVTDDDGDRSTDVLLDWRHDSADQSLVRIGSMGWVTGNKEGQTGVFAGADGLWARRPVEVTILPSKDREKTGGGFPELKLTDRDVDPATGRIREGNPDAPALWQETVDYVNNIFWLNLQSPAASYAFQQQADTPRLWRLFHVERLMEMVELVWMDEEFTRRGENEPPDLWVSHRVALENRRVQTIQNMWSTLRGYVEGGRLEVN
ncbi:MAG TPA: hypothetical protein VG318_15325 [Actinomycetota bacterium]|nr:hypothetical protein [Actinomycetota bacterium]